MLYINTNQTYVINMIRCLPEPHFIYNESIYGIPFTKEQLTDLPHGEIFIRSVFKVK